MKKRKKRKHVRRKRVKPTKPVLGYKIQPEGYPFKILMYLYLFGETKAQQIMKEIGMSEIFEKNDNKWHGQIYFYECARKLTRKNLIIHTKRGFYDINKNEIKTWKAKI
jgi:hypothetical protein